MNGTPCDETCEGFSHTYLAWNNKNTELENKLPRWTRNPKYAEFWAIEAEKAVVEEMMADDLVIRATIEAEQIEQIEQAEQDAFALADAEHDEEIQAAAEEFFDEQELIRELNTVFEAVPAAAVPQTPKKPSWATVVKQAPGAPKKINRLMFSDVENWGDIE